MVTPTVRLETGPRGAARAVVDFAPHSVPECLKDPLLALLASAQQGHRTRRGGYTRPVPPVASLQRVEADSIPWPVALGGLADRIRELLDHALVARA